MTVVRYVLVKLRPGVDIDAFETFEREVDYPKAAQNPSIMSYRTHRIDAIDAGVEGGPWDFLERIEVTSRADYEKQAAGGAAEFLDLLYTKYLDRSKTVALWSELIEPADTLSERPRALVRYVLAALQPGVDRDAYEAYEREVDYVVAGRLPSIVSYRTHRLTDVVGPLAGGPWHYFERIEITDRKAYEADIATLGKELIGELYGKYLERSKTRSIWTTRVDP
jgi:hypothetical protein